MSIIIDLFKGLFGENSSVSQPETANNLYASYMHEIKHHWDNCPTRLVDIPISDVEKVEMAMYEAMGREEGQKQIMKELSDAHSKAMHGNAHDMRKYLELRKKYRLDDDKLEDDL